MGWAIAKACSPLTSHLPYSFFFQRYIPILAGGRTPLGARNACIDVLKAIHAWVVGPKTNVPIV